MKKIGFIGAYDKTDLILYVVDVSVALDDSDREIITLLEDKNVIILLFKIFYLENTCSIPVI